MKAIKSITRFELGGITYSWTVKTADSITRYINFDDNGITIAKEYSIDRLPKAAKTFIERHDQRMIEEDESTGFKRYFIG